MGSWEKIKVKLGMAAPHMKPADVVPWGEFGWVVEQWYRLGKFWRTGFFCMTGIAAVGWYFYVDAEVNRQPIPPVIHSTLLDVDGRVLGTYTSTQGKEPPPKVREFLAKDFFFRLRRVPGSVDAVNDNFVGLTSFMGKSTESKVRACLDKNPVENVIDAGIRREVKNMRYREGQMNRASITMSWTENDIDQMENIRESRNVELSGTVGIAASCDSDHNPYCFKVEEFQWNISGC